MRTAPICNSCGSLVQERRTFTDDGPVVVATVCHCGHVDSFTLTFENSRTRASAAPPVGSSQDCPDAPQRRPGLLEDAA